MKPETWNNFVFRLNSPRIQRKYSSYSTLKRSAFSLKEVNAPFKGTKRELKKKTVARQLNAVWRMAIDVFYG